MKKLLALVVAVDMVLGMSATVFAEPFSYGSQGQTVEVEGDGITVTDTDTKLATPDAAQLIGNGVTQPQLAVVLNKDITAPTVPATISFTVNGTASPQKIYVFHYTDDAWHIEGSGDPKTVTVTVDKLSPFAVVVYTPAGASGSSGAKSPKTGETNAIPAALAVVIGAGAVAFVLSQKKSRA